MKYFEKKIASWEIKYGQIGITGNDYKICKKLFSHYISKEFTLETHIGIFYNKHFLHEEKKKCLRLACNPFFARLNEGQSIYLFPINKNKIGISNIKPSDHTGSDIWSTLHTNSVSELTSHLIHYLEENQKLREENEELQKYKDRLNKYQYLEYIFEDEKFMEDWLERNIHKALANLEVIDRQPIITWKESFMRNKPDFFCLDKTTRELVIVENKVKGRYRKIGTQFLTYSAWVRRNIEHINNIYADKRLNATGNFRFVIITDTIDERLQAICEDSQIALLLIDGGVIFEEIIPYYFE